MLILMKVSTYLIIVALFTLFFLAALIHFNYFLKIDKCLDNSGKWHYEKQNCEYSFLKFDPNTGQSTKSPNPEGEIEP